MMLFLMLLSAVLASAFRVVRVILVSTYFRVFTTAFFATTMATFTVLVLMA